MKFLPNPKDFEALRSLQSTIEGESWKDYLFRAARNGLLTWEEVKEIGLLFGIQHLMKPIK